MHDCIDFCYKHRAPQTTISLILDFLSDLGAVVEADFHYTERFYSVKVKIKNTHITAEGKGKSIPYCLASALGELHERLVNLAYFRANGSLYHSEASMKTHFLAEKEQFNKRYYEMMGHYTISKEVKDALLMLIEAGRNRRITKFKSMAYEASLLVPTRLIDYLFGTNGMCTGNSESETMCQGFCEIIERHYLRELLKGTTPLFEITKLPDTQHEYGSIMALLQKAGIACNLYLIPNQLGVNICSLTLSIPNSDNVICKIGVHPIKMYAIDRVFTELLQNRGIQNIYSCLENSPHDIVYEGLSNYMNICRNDSGFFSKKMFMRCISEYCEESIPVDYAQACQGIIAYFQKQGLSVFYTKTEIGGMVSYHIIIPNYSEIVSPNALSVEDIKYNLDLDALCSLVNKLPYLTINGYGRVEEILTSYEKLDLLAYFPPCNENAKEDLRLLRENLLSYCSLKKNALEGRAVEHEHMSLVEYNLPAHCNYCLSSDKCMVPGSERRILLKLCDLL